MPALGAVSNYGMVIVECVSKLQASEKGPSTYKGEGSRERVIIQRAGKSPPTQDFESREAPLSKDPLWGRSPHLPLTTRERPR
jgi:hypothetical protein